MNQQTMPNMTLFDLLARQWQSRAVIDRLCFNSDDTLLSISSADGTVALARLADNEPPESRIAVDQGQTTIRPREGKPSPLIRTRVQEGNLIAAGLNGEFLVLTRQGELLRINRSGEIVARVLADKTPIDAFDHCRRTGTIAAVVNDVLRQQSADGKPVRESGLGGREIRTLAFSSDGNLIALAGAGMLTIRRQADGLQPFDDIALPGTPLSLTWSADSRWLACGLLAGGLCLIETTSGRTATVSEFPGPVGSLCWSRPANAIFASGAYRIAGWLVDTPPLDDGATGALATGQAGFVLINTVAAHPGKPLVAAGYANGKITVARIGSSEELVVREAGGPVTALVWSADGRHLAAGDALGSAAIVTFPDQLFK